MTKAMSCPCQSLLACPKKGPKGNLCSCLDRITIAQGLGSRALACSVKRGVKLGGRLWIVVVVSVRFTGRFTSRARCFVEVW